MGSTGVGQIVGYKRVSTVDQKLDRQLAEMKLDKIFEDECSGSTTNRVGLKQAINYVREGDTLIVHSMDRLGRNLKDLLGLVETLNDKGVTIQFKMENLMFAPGDNSPLNKLIFQIMGAVAEFERGLAMERSREGMERARKKGTHMGRPKVLDDAKAIEAKTLRKAGHSAKEIARRMALSIRSVYTLLDLSSNAEQV